jgi:hypothetical protein
MVRQAHTYLVGAMSGATLIAAAIAVFVVLVTAQVFQDWPIAGLGGGGEDSASVSGGRSSGSGAGDGVAANGAVSGAGGAAAANHPHGGKRAAANPISTDSPGGRTIQPGGSAPGSEPGTGTETGGGAAQNGGGSPAPQGSTAATGSGGGGTGGAGGGAGAGSGSGSGGSGSSTSESVANTVNETVNGLDQTVTGGALEKTGVTGLTEGVVEGAVGPESTVGKVVDEATGVVGGLLQPKR